MRGIDPRLDSRKLGPRSSGSLPRRQMQNHSPTCPYTHACVRNAHARVCHLDDKARALGAPLSVRTRRAFLARFSPLWCGAVSGILFRENGERDGWRRRWKERVYRGKCGMSCANARGAQVYICRSDERASERLVGCM